MDRGRWTVDRGQRTEDRGQGQFWNCKVKKSERKKKERRKETTPLLNRGGDRFKKNMRSSFLKPGVVRVLAEPCKREPQKISAIC